MSHSPVVRDFYTVAAQVIPVLFLALAFEMRIFGRIDGPPEKDVFLASIRLYAFFLILWGEGQALHVLSAQSPTHQAHKAVVGALVTEGVLLGAEPVAAFLRAGAAQVPSKYEKHLHLALRILLVLVGLVLGAIGIVLFIHGD